MYYAVSDYLISPTNFSGSLARYLSLSLANIHLTYHQFCYGYLPTRDSNKLVGIGSNGGRTRPNLTNPQCGSKPSSNIYQACRVVGSTQLNAIPP